MSHGYQVALFDVLGFEKKLADIGLDQMLTLYKTLIDVVNAHKKRNERVFGEWGFGEAPHWTSEGNVFIYNKIYGAYASDSILLWSSRTWPGAREINPTEKNSTINTPATAWVFKPVPCDNFLDVCNELMCRSIEIGLPLRGAISIGDAILDENERIFLGTPIVEAARLEKGQRFIGLGFCKSTSKQIIPKRFTVPFVQHLKDGYELSSDGMALDWPRHWRKTRKADLKKVISDLDIDPAYSVYYRHTLAFVACSQSYANRFESREETAIRSVYEEFSWSNTELTILARATRKVPIEDE